MHTYSHTYSTLRHAMSGLLKQRAFARRLRLHWLGIKLSDMSHECVCASVCACAQKIAKHDFILICVLRMRAHTCWYLFENSCFGIFLVCKLGSYRI